MQGSLRIAHCGGLHSDFDILIQTINVVAKLLGHPIQWDTETVGCDPSLSSIPVLEQRLLHDALAEVRSWPVGPGESTGATADRLALAVEGGGEVALPDRR